MRIGLRPLELGNGFVDLAHLEIELPQLEFDREIGWEPFRALLAFGKQIGLFVSLKLFEVLRVIRSVLIERAHFMIEFARHGLSYASVQGSIRAGITRL